MPTSVLVVFAALGVGTMMWFLAGDRAPPPNPPPDYESLRAQFLPTSRWTTALMFSGMMLALPLAFGVGYGRPLLIQAGVVLLGMVAPPVIWVIYKARSRNRLNIDEYLRFEKLSTPFLAARPVAFSKRIIVSLLIFSLACVAALFVET